MPDPLLYLQAIGSAVVVSMMVMLAMFLIVSRHWGLARSSPIIHSGANGIRKPQAARETLEANSRGESWLNSACVLAIGLGLAVGYYVMALRWNWPPANGLDRFLTIIIPAALFVELVASLARTPRWLAWFLRLCLAAATPRILLHGSVYLNGGGDDWSPWQVAATLVVCGAMLAGLWALLSWLLQRSSGISIPLALGMSTQCAGLTVMMAGYIKGGAAAFPLVAVVVATTFGAWLISKRSTTAVDLDTPAVIGVGILGLFSLLFIGRFFGELSTSRALTILLAPLLCWATEVRLLRGGKPWLVGSVRLVLVSVPLVVVLWLAKREFNLEMAPLLGSVD